MSTYDPSSTPAAASTVNRERSLALLAGLLGIVMFGLGFLRWLKAGNGGDQTKFSAYALTMPTVAIVGFSVAAGLIAFLGATERRPGRGVPSAVPTGLAATSLLLAIGVLLGKGQVDPHGSKVGVEIGLILGLIVAAIQTLVLAAGLASRHDDGRSTSSSAVGDGPLR